MAYSQFFLRDSVVISSLTLFFFFNDTATTEIYTLSLHDALPICVPRAQAGRRPGNESAHVESADSRSEEHTSELQSPCNLVCRLLLEKKRIQCITPIDSSSPRSRIIVKSLNLLNINVAIPTIHCP